MAAPSRAFARRPLVVPVRSRRALEEHLLVRVPGLAVLFAWVLSLLRPQSRVRQALLWRNVGLSLAATNRRDFDAVLSRYDPAVEFVPADELVQLGIAPFYLGHDGFRRLWDDWDAAWAGHAQWEPSELIDLGDRVLILAGMRGTGERSGIEVDMDFAILATLRNGRVIREQHYLDPATALEAAGLAA